jgi:hypothetical protein
VEFALPASGAPSGMPPVARALPRAQPAHAMRPDKQQFKASDQRVKEVAHEPKIDDQNAAASHARRANSGSADDTASAVVKVAEEYGAKVFDLMLANIHATLECAQQLVKVRTPTEFVELSVSQARNQLELTMKQAAELGSMAQRLARANTKLMTAGK